MATHKVLAPGTTFPSLTVPQVRGGELAIVPPGKETLVVFYRGEFCPICQATLTDIQANLAALKDLNIDVVAISADKKDKAEELVDRLKLTFPVCYELSEDDMRRLGLFVSDPTNYIPQKHRFNEPAWFLTREDGTIRYVDVGSAPLAGRPHLGFIMGGIQYVRKTIIERPEFATVVWGSA